MTDASDEFSDFSDLDDLTVVELLQQVDSLDETTRFAIADIEDIEAPRGLRLPNTLLQYSQPDSGMVASLLKIRSDTDQRLAGRREEREREREPEPEVEPAQPDTRSPLERFRKPPKKVLSVTDLVSPSWCELQYFYTLTKHGRKRRTPAMKQGTQVHQALEEEIHISVAVDTPTREDGWGLRIWNIIQGLRSLQQTGRTRELEVWGTVGGEIVNGIIDEISYECPDPGLEDKVDKHVKQPDLPEGQVRITDFLAPAAQQEGGQSMAAALGSLGSKKEKRIYITDIKTRQSKSLPSPNAIKPTILQLHLYHHMLENMAQGNLALEKLSERYKFEVDQMFSDSFIAQVGSLNQDLFETPSSSADSIEVLLQHNTVASLWSHMLDIFRDTFLLPVNETPTPTPQTLSELKPDTAQPTRLSPILTVEYLPAWYQHRHGEATRNHSLGRKSFVFNAQYLKSYLEDSLTWWHGEREAKGVELQEAWKCRVCDFRDDCEWIHNRDKAALQEAMERKALREEAYKSQGTKSKV